MDARVLVCVPTAEFARQAAFYDHLRIALDPTYVRAFMSTHGQSPARNRNIAIEHAIMAPENFTHVFFIDDDVIIPRDAISKLIAHDVDMVSGAYLMRSYPHQFIAFDIQNNDGSARHFYPERSENGLVEIKTGGLGCCLIKTDVFRAMLPDCNLTGNNVHDWIRLGEQVTDHWCDDLGFFVRTKKYGYKLYLDLSVKCGHMCTVTIYPDYNETGHIVRYDSNGKKSVAFPMPVLSELINETVNV